MILLTLYSFWVISVSILEFLALKHTDAHMVTVLLLPNNDTSIVYFESHYAQHANVKNNSIL